MRYPFVYRSDDGLALERSPFFTFYGGQFTFSTQLLTLNYLSLSFFNRCKPWFKIIKKKKEKWMKANVYFVANSIITM